MYSDEIVDFLIACFESAGGARKYLAGIVAAKKLLRRHRKNEILDSAIYVKGLLDYNFIKGVKRGLNLYG